MASDEFTLPGEIWKPVSQYEGFYEVSSLGRVRSISRFVNCQGGSLALKRRRMLKQHIAKQTGYAQVHLSKEGRAKTLNVHRLVCIAFHGLQEGMQVAHIDGSRDKNCAENLRWDDARGNASDRLIHGTQQMGEQQHLAKLTEADVLEMRSLYTGTRGDLPKLARRYGITSTQALNIVKRKHWKHI